ncbi:uncharacterized protein LOC108088092 [Drosophila ficusphila]|uniref:uncharacterized protein LOC108088092 n=1 Tax=Drosophila ficusphila TaxID=30025 RepID=UPI0007E5C809|nr:uncharacterized protein LOC108088092 [Drosophila ficusphila]
MNPACRLNLESRECQEWMNEVCAHCAHLLPSAEEADLWDKWWADDLPAPFKSRVGLMSAYDCHRLRKEVARQVEAHGKEEWHESGRRSVMWSICRLILVILVMISAVIAIIFALRMLYDGIRRWYPPVKCVTKKKPKTPPPSSTTDVETPPPKDRCKPLKQPKAFISFGRSSDPRTRFGPYNHQKLLKTAASLRDCQPSEPNPAKKKPTSQTSKKSDQHVEQQSGKNKSATK